MSSGLAAGFGDAATTPRAVSPGQRELSAGAAQKNGWAVEDPPESRRRSLVDGCAVGVAVVLAASPLASGYFGFAVWAPLELGALALMVALLRVSAPALSRAGVIATGALVGLLVLSAASLLWAESKEASWTDTNRLGLYCALFVLVLLSVRECRTARLMLLVVGASAVVASLWLCTAMLLGAAGGAFQGRRLNAPIGYVNGTAGLLAMGLWPWLACAESARRRMAQAGALALAVLIAGTLVLTESRAVIPATIVAAVFVVISARGRLRRVANLGLLVAAVAATLPWTLRVYSAGGLSARSQQPPVAIMRAAAIAIVLSALGAAGARLALARWGQRPLAAGARRARRRAGRAMLAGAGLAVIVAGVVAAPWVGREYRAFTALRVDQPTTARFFDAGGYRYDLWRVAVREFAAHPVGGLGAGNYDVEYYRRRHNPEYVIQPHSLELQMAAELGLGGLVLLLAFCAAVLWAACRGRETLAAEDRFVKVAATGMFTAWLVGTSVDWLYDIPGLTGMGVMAAGLLVLPARPARSRTTDRARRLALTFGLAAVALLAASVGRQYVASRYYEAGAGEVARSPAAAVGSLQQAASLDPYALNTLYALAAAYAREDRYRLARAVLESASAREPHNYVPPALLGDLALRRGDRRLAASEYRLASRLDPRDPAVSWSVRAASAGAR